MKVLVKVFGELRALVGGPSLELELDGEKTTMLVLVRHLEKEQRELVEAFMDGDALRQYYILLINGLRADTLDGLNTEIRDGDEVAIFAPVAGG